MLDAVRKMLIRYRMVKPGEVIVVGVSGGPDSITLLHVLWRLAPEFGYRLHVVHINHGMRLESEEEAQFVTKFATELGLSVKVVKLDRAKLTQGSFEELAREARREVFFAECKAIGAGKVALGHNANDQAETILQRLIRGGGTNGLGGIYPVRDRIIRPLLFCTRAQIERYLLEKKLDYRIDQSNLKPIYLRNKIRLQLLPLLQAEYNPRLIESLGRTGLILQQDNCYLEAEARRIGQDLVSVVANGFLLSLAAHKLPEPILNRIIRNIYAKLVADPRGLEFEHTQRTTQFLETGHSGGYLELPMGVKIYKEQDGALFVKGRLNFPQLHEQLLQIPGDTKIDETGIIIECRILETMMNMPALQQEDMGTAVFDFDKLDLPLRLRGRLPGDKVRLRGSYRKIKEIYNRHRIPIRLRETRPLLVQGNEVLWVPGVVRSDIAKVDDSTNRIMYLKVCKDD